MKPDDVGSASSAGNSSTRTNLSGSSRNISNSIGTRLSPRTRFVRPVATMVFTAASFWAPSAFLAAVSTSSALLTDSGLAGLAGGAGACASAMAVAVADRRSAAVAGTGGRENRLVILRFMRHRFRTVCSSWSGTNSTAAETASGCGGQTRVRHGADPSRARSVRRSYARHRWVFPGLT